MPYLARTSALVRSLKGGSYIGCAEAPPVPANIAHLRLRDWIRGQARAGELSAAIEPFLHSVLPTLGSLNNAAGYEDALKLMLFAAKAEAREAHEQNRELDSLVATGKALFFSQMLRHQPRVPGAYWVTGALGNLSRGRLTGIFHDSARQGPAPLSRRVILRHGLRDGSAVKTATVPNQPHLMRLSSLYSPGHLPGRTIETFQQEYGLKHVVKIYLEGESLPRGVELKRDNRVFIQRNPDAVWFYILMTADLSRFNYREMLCLHYLADSARHDLSLIVSLGAPSQAWWFFVLLHVYAHPEAFFPSEDKQDNLSCFLRGASEVGISEEEGSDNSFQLLYMLEILEGLFRMKESAVNAEASPSCRPS